MLECNYRETQLRLYLYKYRYFQRSSLNVHCGQRVAGGNVINTPCLQSSDQAHCEKFLWELFLLR